MKKTWVFLAAVSMVFVLTSCGKYYMVTDPSTDKTYYTKKIKSQKGGAVQFEDGKSGSDITIQNSEVKQISKDEYVTNTTMHEAKESEQKEDAEQKADETPPASE